MNNMNINNMNMMNMNYLNNFNMNNNMMNINGMNNLYNNMNNFNMNNMNQNLNMNNMNNFNMDNMNPNLDMNNQNNNINSNNFNEKNLINNMNNLNLNINESIQNYNEDPNYKVSEGTKLILNNSEILRGKLISNTQTISPTLKCAICTDLVMTPVECETCSKLFCKYCIDEWLKKSNECPNKHQFVKKEELDKWVKDILQKNLY